MNRLPTFFFSLLMFAAGTLFAREQWTEEQAWAWQKEVGVIKGFNEPYPAYPDMSRTEVLQKAHEAGLNSVRFWVRGNTAEEQIEYIQKMIDDADRFGMTVSPVISFVADRYWQNRGKQPMKEYEATVRQVVRNFAQEKRIVFWELWNEPRYEDKAETYEQLDIIEQMVGWCRDENIEQPITSSIIWATIKEDSKSLKRMTEVEAMMDIHNFHYYNCALDFSKHIYDMMDYLQKIGDRPMVATECLTRTNGSGIARTLAAFSKYKVNFYVWGLYVNDRNWETRWGQSTYDPYGPMFHNLFYSDGDVYDSRETDMLKDYRFCEKNEELYPPLERTERWSHERAWKWMVTGPLKGFTANKLKSLPHMDGYNAVKIAFSYNTWKADTASFFRQMDGLLAQAAEKGWSVMPLLLTDDDFQAPHQSLAEYVGSVVGRYYCDTRIKAWELYHHPGEKVNDTNALEQLVKLLFRYARNQYANQPLTMTPYVQVNAFEPGFDYWGALVHGRTGGWDRLVYGGGSNARLCYTIWSLSDIISFSACSKAPEAGWLASICFRFGRPVFCTQWNIDDSTDIDAYLQRFAKSQIFWFSSGTDIMHEKLVGYKIKKIKKQRLTNKRIY